MLTKILICTLMIGACMKPIYAAKRRRQATYGSTVVPAGNPNLPSFSLSEEQTANLPPIHPDIYQDTLLSTPILAYKRGYATEIHRVVTSDGYILEVHRIVSSPFHSSSRSSRSPRSSRSSRSSRTARKSRSPRVKPVVFLQHGFLDSSATWVMSGVDHGFGYALADAGYDVWMGNARGNVYSRKHVKYDPDGDRINRERFWTFSWHEIGVIDIPAMIDYVLHTTNQTDLFYVGHSQGTTSFFVMCSERPEYNNKIKMMHALAPVAYMDNAVSPFVRIAELVPSALQLLQFIDSELSSIQRAITLLGAYEFLPSIDFFKLIGQQICRDTSPFIAICESVLFLITGFNERNLNATLFPVYLSHTPAGAATYQLVHYVQEARSGRFSQFDWGTPEENMAKHGREIPPEYNLQNVKARTILHYSDNDWLSSPIDVDRLYKQLPNVERNHIPDERFEHMDFVWGIGARKVLYDPIITSMLLYDKLAGLR